jgi:hypothetical protein
MESDVGNTIDQRMGSDQILILPHSVDSTGGCEMKLSTVVSKITEIITIILNYDLVAVLALPLIEEAS